MVGSQGSAVPGAEGDQEDDAMGTVVLLDQCCSMVWASLMAGWVKNSPAVQETQEMRVRSLDWEDLLEGNMAMHSSNSYLKKKSVDRGACWAMAHRVTKGQTRLSDKARRSM